MTRLSEKHDVQEALVTYLIGSGWSRMVTIVSSMISNAETRRHRDRRESKKALRLCGISSKRWGDHLNPVRSRRFSVPKAH